MNYHTFRERLDQNGLFSIGDIKKSFPDFDSRRLVEWQSKGYIRKIINRWYLFADVLVDEPMRFRIANRIYHPAYISMESALEYYHLIPEAVFTTTSLSTNKTIVFDTPAGAYAYSRVKPALFFGYQIVERHGFPVKIAEPEKLLLDYLYLNTHIKSEKEIMGMRLNQERLRELLHLDKFHQYLRLFHSKALTKRSMILLEHMEVC